MRRIIAGILILGAMAGSALAGFTSPEIDPASGLAALAAIGGAMLIIRGRRKN